MKNEWDDKKNDFEVIDVRDITGNFLPMIIKKAEKVDAGDGLCVVQSFEPIPLYSVLSDMGFEHTTDKVEDNEYRVYFYRIEVKEVGSSNNMDVPLKPTAMINFNLIDPQLADIVIHFWELIWEPKKAVIDQKTKYLLSLANGVGSGRLRQATRELVKAYAAGVTVAELDELFTMFVWNQGVGTFASEIGPSPLFAAYKLIKKNEGNGTARSEIVVKLVEQFGEQNPEVGALYK